MSILSRRSFIAGGAAAAALAGPLSWLSPTESEAATTAARTAPRLTRTALKPHLNQRFHLAAHGHRVSVRLTAIENIAGAAPGADHRFGAILRAPRGHRLIQDVYHLSRAGYGSVRVLVVPVGRGRKANFYQVIVNNI
jgi:hypothetical protein